MKILAAPRAGARDAQILNMTCSPFMVQTADIDSSHLKYAQHGQDDELAAACAARQRCGHVREVASKLGGVAAGMCKVTEAGGGSSKCRTAFCTGAAGCYNPRHVQHQTLC